LRGAFGRFYAAPSMDVMVFEQMPESRYEHTITSEGVRKPHTETFGFDIQRQIGSHFSIESGVRQQNGKEQFIVEPVEADSAALNLDNGGQPRYRESHVRSAYRHNGRDFTASYTRSEALGDLNDYDSYFGATPYPVIRPNQYSRLPYDSPHRFE